MFSAPNHTVKNAEAGTIARARASHHRTKYNREMHISDPKITPEWMEYAIANVNVLICVLVFFSRFACLACVRHLRRKTSCFFLLLHFFLLADRFGCLVNLLGCIVNEKNLLSNFRYSHQSANFVFAYIRFIRFDWITPHVLTPKSIVLQFQQQRQPKTLFCTAFTSITSEWTMKMLVISQYRFIEGFLGFCRIWI